MITKLRWQSLLLAVLWLALAAASPSWTGSASESVDEDAIETLKREELSRSQAMQVAESLTDVYGPRLTGSPLLQEAAEWTVQRLKRWGISGAATETWGAIGAGWVNERFSAHAMTPYPWPIVGLPKAWTPGTDGVLTAPGVYAPIVKDEDFDSWRGKLRGAIVLPRPAPSSLALFEPLARRLSESDLAALARGERARAGAEPTGSQIAFARRRTRFLIEEGALAIVEPSRGGGSALFVQQGGDFDTERIPGSPIAPYTQGPAQIVIATEQYGRLSRLISAGRPVTLELDVRNRFLPDRLGINVIAELPGGDKAEEIVMLGAHLDSWHGGTGATDNAAGVAVVLEVMRLLKVTGLPLRRTVRLALWSGEEQGLLGSRAFVASRLANRETMALKDEHDRVSVYFNLDNGTGAIRGVYLQGNDAVAPIFAAWMKPFTDQGLSTLSPASTFSSDHVSFDEVGVPAFQFIQDPVEYDTRTHHSNSDTFERLLPDDVVRNALVVAAFVYHAANREERLPRKPLPAPRVRVSAPRP